MKRKTMTALLVLPTILLTLLFAIAEAHCSTPSSTSPANLSTHATSPGAGVGGNGIRYVVLAPADPAPGTKTVTCEVSARGTLINCTIVDDPDIQLPPMPAWVNMNAGNCMMELDGSPGGWGRCMVCAYNDAAVFIEQASMEQALHYRKWSGIMPCGPMPCFSCHETEPIFYDCEFNPCAHPLCADYDPLICEDPLP